MSASQTFPSQGDDVAVPAKSQGPLGFLSSLFWVYSPSGKRRRIFPGWWEVAAGASHSFFGYGLYLYSWSVIIAAMSKEFGWSATQISVTGTLGAEGGAIEGPVIGWLTDRFGPRWTSAGGWFLAGSGFLLLLLISQLGGNVYWYWFCYGILVLIGMNSALYNSSYQAVQRWFIKNRGLGIGLTSVGAGFGSPILIPVTALIAATFGWRAAVAAFGITYLLMGVTSALTLFRRWGPEQNGFYPDNERPVAPLKLVEQAAETPPVQTGPQLKDFTLGEALRTRSFWFWTLSQCLLNLGAAATALPIFQSLRLQQAGYSTETAALWYAMDFLFTAVGRTAVAFLSDTFHPRIALGVGYMLEGIGFYCFAMASSTPWLLGYAAFHGVFYGWTIALGGGIISGGLFGRKNYGKIRGVFLLITSLANLPGPIFFGYLRDMTGDFYWPFAFGAATYVLGGLLTFMCTTPKGQIEPGRRARSAAAISAH